MLSLSKKNHSNPNYSLAKKITDPILEPSIRIEALDKLLYEISHINNIKVRDNDDEARKSSLYEDCLPACIELLENENQNDISLIAKAVQAIYYLTQWFGVSKIINKNRPANPDTFLNNLAEILTDQTQSTYLRWKAADIYSQILSSLKNYKPPISASEKLIRFIIEPEITLPNSIITKKYFKTALTAEIYHVIRDENLVKEEIGIQALLKVLEQADNSGNEAKETILKILFSLCVYELIDSVMKDTKLKDTKDHTPQDFEIKLSLTILQLTKLFDENIDKSVYNDNLLYFVMLELISLNRKNLISTHIGHALLELNSRLEKLSIVSAQHTQLLENFIYEVDTTIYDYYKIITIKRATIIPDSIIYSCLPIEKIDLVLKTYLDHFTNSNYSLKNQFEDELISRFFKFVNHISFDKLYQSKHYGLLVRTLVNMIREQKAYTSAQPLVLLANLLHRDDKEIKAHFDPSNPPEKELLDHLANWLTGDPEFNHAEEDVSFFSAAIILNKALPEFSIKDIWIREATEFWPWAFNIYFELPDAEDTEDDMTVIIHFENFINISHLEYMHSTVIQQIIPHVIENYNYVIELLKNGNKDDSSKIAREVYSTLFHFSKANDQQRDIFRKNENLMQCLYKLIRSAKGIYKKILLNTLGQLYPQITDEVNATELTIKKFMVTKELCLNNDYHLSSFKQTIAPILFIQEQLDNKSIEIIDYHYPNFITLPEYLVGKLNPENVSADFCLHTDLVDRVFSAICADWEINGKLNLQHPLQMIYNLLLLNYKLTLEPIMQTPTKLAAPLADFIKILFPTDSDSINYANLAIIDQLLDLIKARTNYLIENNFLISTIRTDIQENLHGLLTELLNSDTASIHIDLVTLHSRYESITATNPDDSIVTVSEGDFINSAIYNYFDRNQLPPMQEPSALVTQSIFKATASNNMEKNIPSNEISTLSN